MNELVQVVNKGLAMLRFVDLQRLEIVTNRVTLRRWIEHGDFPRPIHLGKNSVAWRVMDVEAWLEKRAGERQEQ